MSQAITLEARLEAVEKDLCRVEGLVRRGPEHVLGMSVWLAR